MVGEWGAGDGGTAARSEIAVTPRDDLGVRDRVASWAFGVRTSGGVVSCRARLVVRGRRVRDDDGAARCSRLELPREDGEPC